ncbi:LysR family transcriptional regulator [Actinokineospora sp. HUAS TT18]|uniref:LysR family transcriptional regulator n=1 Tax=Actinokineospora sp. HUAS TT18 TaxID=3447451 RepID=UPI003F527698
MDARLLRSFLAIAEEGSLTRAAERLYVSQPALTKQVKHLEALVGVPLFTRSRTGMELTAAGHALAEHAPAVLEANDEAVRAAKAAAKVVRVGFIASAANEATQEIIALFNRKRPGWRVDMRQATWSDPSAGLAGGEVDVALLRLPFPGQERFRVQALFAEPRCVALAATHPLAQRDSVAFADLRDEPFVAAPAETGEWRDYWLAVDHRDTPPRIGAVTDQPDEWLQAIANGYGVALAPESTARFYARPGVVYRPVTGISPSQVAVAWAPGANAVVQDFVAAAVTGSRAAL